MTSEVALLNKGGIALAADSAVTISSGNGAKIYNSANKLFALSKYHPVAVMFYDSASFMGTPWELIVKVYRKKLGKKCFPSVADFASDFLAFLETDRRLSPIEVQQSELMARVFVVLSDIKKRLELKVEELVARNDSVEQLEIETTIFNSVITDKEKEILGFPALENINQETVNKWMQQFQNGIDELKRNLFQQFPISELTSARLNFILVLYLSRQYFFMRTGVVFAGYGESDIFPSVDSYCVENVIADRLKYVREPGNSAKVTYTEPAKVLVFGQSEEMISFLTGVAPSISKLQQTELSTLSGFPLEIINAEPSLSDDQKRLLCSAIESKRELLLKAINEKRDTFKAASFINPLYAALGSLPKDELASAAEALVNLTSFKRRVSMDAETVGGPIDVAVISKGDGLVWIKRKHYFKPELNHQFAANYFENQRENQNEEQSNSIKKATKERNTRRKKSAN